jgi:hypothetical protein
MFSCNSIRFRVTRARWQRLRSSCEPNAHVRDGVTAATGPGHNDKTRCAPLELYGKRSVVPGLVSNRAHLRRAPQIED